MKNSARACSSVCSFCCKRFARRNCRDNRGCQARRTTAPAARTRRKRLQTIFSNARRRSKSHRLRKNCRRQKSQIARSFLSRLSPFAPRLASGPFRLAVPNRRARENSMRRATPPIRRKDLGAEFGWRQFLNRRRTGRGQTPGVFVS